MQIDKAQCAGHQLKPLDNLWLQYFMLKMKT